MSQRSEKLHRQVSQLRADVDALQAAWLAQQYSDAVEKLEAAAECARQAHRRAREARAIAQAWRRNAILALILAGLTAGVALTVSVKAAEEDPAAPAAVPIEDDGRLPGDDTPAQEPPEAPVETTLLDQAHVLEDVTVTHYDICMQCCGKVDGITASGARAMPYVTVAVDPSVIPLGTEVLVDYGDGELHQYRAEDTGSAIHGGHIDLCVSSHEEALQLGRRTATVYWMEVA